MKYNQLSLEANKSRKRVGRGISAGQGKTAGRGTKGQNARTGKTARPGFEGGQNPLMQRVPKLRGFKPFWEPTVTVTTDVVSELKSPITNKSLYEARITDSEYATVKLVLGRQKLTKKLTVTLQGATAAAVAAVEAAGGTFEKVAKVARPSKKKA